MTGRLGERRIASDDRRPESFGQSHIHGVVGGDVFPQLPRASQEIDVGMAVEIEIGQIRNRPGPPGQETPRLSVRVDGGPASLQRLPGEVNGSRRGS